MRSERVCVACFVTAVVSLQTSTWYRDIFGRHALDATRRAGAPSASAQAAIMAAIAQLNQSTPAGTTSWRSVLTSAFRGVGASNGRCARACWCALTLLVTSRCVHV
jgi:hypothetical protein